MTKKTYYEKLKDPRWQKKRLEVMEYNEFRCEVCMDDESTLNVHHKEYFKDKEPWEYEVRQLACLCESCHESKHEGDEFLKYICSLLRMDGPCNRDELGMLIAGFICHNNMIDWAHINDKYPALAYPYMEDLFMLGIKASEANDALTAERIKSIFDPKL